MAHPRVVHRLSMFRRSRVRPVLRANVSGSLRSSACGDLQTLAGVAGGAPLCHSTPLGSRRVSSNCLCDAKVGSNLAGVPGHLGGRHLETGPHAGRPCRRVPAAGMVATGWDSGRVRYIEGSGPEEQCWPSGGAAIGDPVRQARDGARPQRGTSGRLSTAPGYGCNPRPRRAVGDRCRGLPRSGFAHTRTAVPCD